MHPHPAFWGFGWGTRTPMSASKRECHASILDQGCWPATKGAAVAAASRIVPCHWMQPQVAKYLPTLLPA
jgi:hypothetical protein